jgi:hypothetical protein
MSGWRAWTIGEVVEADDFQSFVQDQVVQNYANSAARGSALGTAVAEGMVAYLQDTNLIEVYDGSQWVNFTGDITGVTAGTALTGGGTSGNVTLNVDQSALTLAQSQVTGLVSDLAGKEATITGGATTITSSNLTASRALLSDGSGKVAVSAVTSTELGHLDGVTSAIQTQLNAKSPINNPTFTGVVAGNASAAATAANAASSLGFKGIPASGAGASGAYTLVAGDAGELVYTTTSRTVTIPANSSVGFAIGTTIVFVSGPSATTTIAITTDTMRLAGAGTTGSRTLAAHGMATAVKVAATEWYISGNGLT